MKSPYEPPDIEITLFDEEETITINGLNNFAGYPDEPRRCSAAGYGAGGVRKP